MSPKIIFIEGNIGAGKTTFLKVIENHNKKVQVIYEPVDEWRKSGMLQKFYKNPKEFGKTFQFYCLYTRFKLFEEIDDTVDYVFIERSMMCDNFVFAKNCLNDEEYLEYNTLYQNFLDLYRNLYNYTFNFLYLYQPAWICHRHILKRGRQEENTITLDYIQSLEHFHNSWLRSISEEKINGLFVWKENDQTYMTSTLEGINRTEPALVLLEQVLNTI
jgi:deoxycitidine kinase